jgi:hypothetical protein
MTLIIDRHERRWPSAFACPLHNDDWPMPAEAERRGNMGHHHAKCPICGRRVWVEDFYTRRATDGRLRATVRDILFAP